MFLDKKILSWALYDWANSAFATTVMAGFFPIFFKNYWSQGMDAHESTWFLGLCNSSASFALALIAPFLGALADKGSRKKRFLGLFALFGILATATLSFIPQGQYQWAALFFALASMGFWGANIFYDSLIVYISPTKHLHTVSSYGYSLGYLGGGLLFLVNVLMMLFPESFFLENKIQAVQVSFLSVSVWWFLFSLPTLCFIEEPQENLRLEPNFKDSWKEVLQTLKALSKNRNLLLFFLAYLFYFDGVNTTIKMSVDYGISLGFATDHLIAALLLVQFIGFPAAIAFGFLGEKWGAKKGIYLALFVYMGVIIGAYYMHKPIHFYMTATAIGCVQGGLQALSRSYFTSMIPKEKAGEYFGLFNMVGKSSAIIGPLAVGFVSSSTQNSRLSILVILLFFIVGSLLLSTVRENKTS